MKEKIVYIDVKYLHVRDNGQIVKKQHMSYYGY